MQITRWTDETGADLEKNRKIFFLSVHNDETI